MNSEALLLVAAVAGVGILHTIVPDHWVPITLIARQRGWSKAETARASFQAGIGHVLSTLAIGIVVWIAGVAFAAKFGNMVDTVASMALVAFGCWVMISAFRELSGSGGHGHGHSHGHGHESDPAHDPLYAPLGGGTAVLMRHAHMHRHGSGSAHLHFHDHEAATAHAITSEIDASPPPHTHKHKTSSRTALILILGSSPMVEGIPAFFAAGRYGIGLIALMAVVFAISTIATYMLLCVYSAASLQRMRLGSFERYGEVLSGAFIALVGVAFYVWPIL